MDKITFISEENEEIDFYVLDQTRINGKNYLLVSDSMEEEAEALILRDDSSDGDTESLYNIVDDDVELNAVAKVFEEAIGDVKIEQ